MFHFPLFFILLLLLKALIILNDNIAIIISIYDDFCLLGVSGTSSPLLCVSPCMLQMSSAFCSGLFPPPPLFWTETFLPTAGTSPFYLSSFFVISYNGA